jgi:hypothetical protein
MTKPARFLFASFFALIIAILMFNVAAGPEWLWIYHILALILLLGGVGFAVYGYHTYGFDGRFGILLFTYVLCMVMLIGVVLQQMGPGFPNPGRMAKLTLIALLFLFFLAISPRQIAFTKKTGVYLVAFAVLFLIYLYHSVPFDAASGSAAFPIAAGFMMGLNLFVLPRYVSRDAFLWVLSGISSFFVLIGIPAYYIGDYTFLGMEVRVLNNSFTPLLLNGEITVMESVFANPNTFGVLAFSGTVAAAILAHRLFPGVGLSPEDQRVRADGASATVLSFSFVRSLSLFCLAGVMFAISAMGTYLSYSRASLLAIALSLVLYFSYVSLGRRSLPYTLGALVGGFALFLLIIPELGINPAGRFALWSGSVEAFLANPTLFGEGIDGTGEIIAPFVEQPYKGSSSHNAYLSQFLRAGLVGGMAFLVIIVGSLLSGVIRYQQVDVPALVLAFGFAINQFFESYSLFRHSMPAVLATLAFGYLIMDGSLFHENESEDTSDERDSRRRRESWSRPEWNR